MSDAPAALTASVCTLRNSEMLLWSGYKRKDESSPVTVIALSPLRRFISWESKELDERPHALFLTAGGKSPGSCQLGDTMEARPKQFRQKLWLRALPLKQLQELGKCVSQLRGSSRVIEWYDQAERKHHFIQCG